MSFVRVYSLQPSAYILQGAILHFNAKGFAKRLRIALAADDRNQGELEELAGVTQGQISRWKGGTMPDLPSIARMVELLNVSADWLLFGEGEMRPSDPSAEVAAFREIADIVLRVDLNRRGRP